MAHLPTHHVQYGTHDVEFYIYPPVLQAANSGDKKARETIIAAVNKALEEKGSNFTIEVSAVQWVSNFNVNARAPSSISCFSRVEAAAPLKRGHFHSLK